jgi:hypothetical protein
VNGGSRVGMSWGDALLFVGGLCVGLIILYWRSYVGKRAEKNAEIDSVDRKIDRVLDQQEQLTKATEKIKTDLSDQSLAKQRLRDMRREVAFKLMNLLGTLEEILIAAATEAKQLHGLPHVEQHHLKKLNEIYDRYQRTLGQMAKVKGQVSMVFDDPARELFFAVDEAAGLVIHITNHFHYSDDKATQAMSIYNERYVRFHTLIREQVLS